ncbi:TagA domain-containing protein [Providencia manganoxydans]|uniref:TagA domain-containing protein n=1 Tax=Providencia manganoxydans TaxID=2923283 RepID=UPI003F71FCC8
MKIHINSDKINIKHGEKLYFKSNGQSWEQLSKVIHSKKPYKQGIPVVTLIGYYDPENQLQHFIAPALEGSYGMVYHPDAENQQGAFLRITLANGQMIDYKLNQSRAVNNKMNKFHINIERKLSPIKAELFIKGKSILTQEIQLDNEELTTTINGITQ